MQKNPSITGSDTVEFRYRLAQVVARHAGVMALQLFRRRDQLSVEYKGLQDMVSAADRDVERFIRAQVQAVFPADGFLGEEGGGDRLDAEFLWVIDPIDGTACFVNGMHAWCVSIAVLRAGEPVVGVIYDPSANELFHARRGGGAFCDDAPMHVHGGKSLHDGILGVGTSTRVGAAAIVPFIAATLAAGGMFVRNGSGALMIAYVAAGRLLGYFEPHMNAWDALAGLVLVHEAGGTGNDFLADDGLQRGNPVLVANATIQRQLERLAGIDAAKR